MSAPKNCRADPYHRCPFLNGDLVVPAHPHRQLAKHRGRNAGSQPLVAKIAQPAKPLPCVFGRVRYGRQRHQPDDPGGATCARGLEEPRDLVGRGAELGRFPREVYLDVQSFTFLLGIGFNLLVGWLVQSRLMGRVLGVGLLVLAVASANLAGLVMVRGVSRRGEVAVRLALGASRMRIVRLLLVENLVLAIPGATLGVLVARSGIPFLVGYAERLAAPLRIHFNTDIDGLVVGFAVAMAAGKKAAGHRPSKIVRLGFAAVTVGLVALLPVVPRADSGWDLLIPLAIVGSGLGLLVSQLNNYTLAPITDERVSEAAGVNSAAGSFGLSFGLAFAGAILLATLSIAFTQMAEDSAVLTVRYASGAYGVLQVCALSWEGTPFNQTHHLEVHGDAGTIYAVCDWDTVQEVRGVRRGERGPAAVLPIPDDIWAGARRGNVHDTYRDVFRGTDVMTREWIAAIAEQRHVRPDFADGLAMGEAEALIEDMETELKAAFPQLTSIYIRPEKRELAVVQDRPEGSRPSP